MTPKTDYTIKILLDSVNPVGVRLTTFECEYPRFIHSEIMTHRMLSKNAASSRAIPIQKNIDKVRDNPVIPFEYGKNQKGMQAREKLSQLDTQAAIDTIVSISRMAIAGAERLAELGLHKQVVNRYLEPFLPITTIISGTDWANFFALRAHPDAQPEFRALAYKMLSLYKQSTPQRLKEGGWHLPLLFEEDQDLSLEVKKQISVGRVARVSHLTHDGKRDISQDIRLHNDLSSANPGHWSPFEHIAQACNDKEYRSNFRGFKQYRKFFQNENVVDCDYF